jgi:hypothetical protein
MVGAYPKDHEDESSESDASEACSEHLNAIEEPSSPTKQSDGQRDKVMDALGDALQSSLTTSTHAPSKGYSIDEAAQQALDALKGQRQQDALSGSSFLPEEYSAPSPDGLFSEGSASPDTTPQNGPTLLGNLDRPPTGPTFSNFPSDPSTTTNIFSTIPPYDPNKSPAGLFSNRDGELGTIWSHGSRSLLGAVEPPRTRLRTSPVEQYEEISPRMSSSGDKTFQDGGSRPTVDPTQERPSLFKLPVQASVDQTKPIPTARTIPESLFDKSFADDVNFFNPPGMTPSHPVQSASPFYPISSFANGTSSLGAFTRSGLEFQKIHDQSNPNHRSVFAFGPGGTKISSHAVKASKTSEPVVGDQMRASEIQEKYEPDSSLSEGSSAAKVGDETQGATSKGQSEHLNTPEDPTTYNPVSAKRPFGQPKFDSGLSESVTSSEFGLGVRPGASESHHVWSRVNSPGEFITAALHDLALHGTNETMITESLTSLYEIIMSFPDEHASRTEGIHQCTKAISNIDAKMLSLKNAHEVVFGDPPKVDKEQKDQAKRVLRWNKILHKEQRDELVTRILHSLELFAKQSGRPSDADSDKGRNFDHGPGGRKYVSGEPSDEDYVQQLLAYLAWCKEENKNTIKEEAKAEWGEKIKSVQQEAATRYQAELVKKLAKCTLDKHTALRQLKDQYATRISDGETKSRLHKKATAKIEELEAIVQRLEREKSELISAKATVEQELEEREIQAKDLQGYQEAYNQIVVERDQLQGEYYDMVAERDEIRQAQGALGDASDQQDIPASTQATHIVQTGSLQSYNNDLNLLENYWTRQENFAEMAMRETAAEIRDVEAQINEAVQQLRLLNGPENASDAEPDATDPESEAEVESQPSATESLQSQLLDTFTNPLHTPPNQAEIPQPTARAPKAGSSRPTWANKTAKAKDSDKRAGQRYVHTSYHGHGVSTVRRVDSYDMRS